ncbi:MAG: metal-sensitive transcriptional regulator [Candidatus Buchananbacteria bacterium]
MEHERENLIALKKAQSHLGKIINMVEEKEYCVDVMQQVLAIIGLLKSVNQNLLADHLKNCFAKAMKASDESRKRQMIEEILKLQKMSSK